MSDASVSNSRGGGATRLALDRPRNRWLHTERRIAPIMSSGYNA